ncbi:TetR family transcriptional regulator [Mumia sp. zg.B17]|uniref:TetR/AcrR family transcriptional regulator n=1 Tax=unclassified Mumia TaxID=2621872 RepID=UPI001C6F3570|nr:MULTISPECIES: TetR/AcrR family transcriptional regulator [unclassified Mumia]MBW9205871.1 TetR family transcriptional regulator [Mumia sp. zg.B17]MBW9208125.1 TetR family transcriptional regulator [Mumia sp. zg.B21]MDD9348511.1 TetR/AcrR family transcriptional regulator [Mumia sp.]
MAVNDTVPRQRDPERTKAEILEVATRTFAEDGYSGARVDDIAERTRTTKRMIYYYFGGKQQLYLAVLEHAYRGIRDAEEHLEVGDLGPVDAIRRLAELTYDHHVEHQDFMRLVAIENIHRGDGIRRLEVLRDLGKPAMEVLETILSRGMADGSFREDVDALDVHLLISAYCVFQVANQYTFGYLFDVDLLADSTRPRLRSMIGDVVVAWLSTPAR